MNLFDVVQFVHYWSRYNDLGIKTVQVQCGSSHNLAHDKSMYFNYLQTFLLFQAFQNYFRQICKLKSSAASEAIQNFRDRALIFSQIQAQCKQKSNLVIHAEFPSDIIYTT